MKLNILPVLLFFLIVTVAWIGFSVYFNTTELDINPSATSYMQHINPTFETKGLQDMIDRSKENLPVSPTEFLSVVSE